ncbi:MAG: hypothetical protein WKF77_21120 [Planctomycetaceae bacterium]
MAPSFNSVGNVLRVEVHPAGRSARGPLARGETSQCQPRAVYLPELRDILTDKGRIT